MTKETYFFSYSRKDAAFVKRLATDLKKEGANVWLDQLDIIPGVAWDDAIQNALNEAYGILAIISDTSTKSKNVMDEISYAIGQGKRIIPLVIEDCQVPFRLGRLQHIDFTQDYNTAFDSLLKTLDTPQSQNETADTGPQKKIASPERFDKKPIKQIYVWAAILIAVVLAVILFKNNDDNKSDISSNSSSNVANEKDDSTINRQTQTPAIENKPASPALNHYEVKFSMTSIKVDPELEYQILESLVEPKDVQNSILKLKIRCKNDGRYDFNFWSASFRLSIDDVPTEPLGYYTLNELVASHAAKDGTIEFEFPNKVKSLKFLVYQNDDKIEIPLSLIAH